MRRYGSRRWIASVRDCLPTDERSLQNSESTESSEQTLPS